MDTVPDLPLDDLTRLIEEMSRRGQAAQAIPLARSASARARRELGPSHPGVVHALMRLAALYETVGDWAAAQAAYLEALGLLNGAVGELQPEIGRALAGLSRALAAPAKPTAPAARAEVDRPPPVAARAPAPTVMLPPHAPPTVPPTVSSAPRPGKSRSAERALSCKATVRYWKRMAPQHVYPLLVVLSAEDIAALGQKGVAQASTDFTAMAGSIVTVEPVLPGCACYPPRQELTLTGGTVAARFHVVPGFEGTVPDARVLLWQSGRLLAAIPLSVKAGKQTIAAVLGIATFVLPYFLKYFHLDLEAQLQDNFALYARVLRNVFELPWWLQALVPAAAAAVAFLWRLPRRGKPAFWDVQLQPPAPAATAT